MFSGIVEITSEVLKVESKGPTSVVWLTRPSSFDDIKAGDSIAINGVCLTVEAFDAQKIQFTLGPETLKVTAFQEGLIAGATVNLERSLRLNDRIHGHIVQGHVDTVAKVVKTEPAGESLFLWMEIPEVLESLVWKKGSITVNGVSLTINEIEGRTFQVCLIPETLKRTNLKNLKPGMVVNLEADSLARFYKRTKELSGELSGSEGVSH